MLVFDPYSVHLNFMLNYFAMHIKIFLLDPIRVCTHNPNSIVEP